ncbi:uncharacterized protein BP5553_03064 [Venustampulla echinocandica]|uniref:Uncharacterized protein n=1 Tax=Venustampulla echinocandica TaxID=2656787 RepID=A0A370TTA7_9HELO|nr:uncharacterized protein BP5553_03064 [Venustampulla echinocandica]RDL38724.1 hypothetical protein BP5553_03064 [Venustampulla echinocandica]
MRASAAQNLYRSNARFLFELIQNAEDNNYSRAKAVGAEPYIKFTIRPGTICIDCNEDGFTPENVRAICRIGESTKIRANSQYYIGEKGIGFKSGFMVASKVHIQSGAFSFFFDHEPGNNGMGMITPIWEPADVTLAEPLTRITLTLPDWLDLDELLSQFDELPQTLLLFMKKLGKIIMDEDVQEYRDVQVVADVEEEEEEQEDEDDEETEPNTRVKSITTCSCKFDQNIGRGQVTVSIDRGEEAVACSDEYRITRKNLSNLPADGQRGYNTAEKVYAFLPIRDFGHPFIIHSDFVMQASREDIMENAGNKAILEGVAEAFVDAVLQFYQHPVLQYQWMSYIPNDDKVLSPFWSDLSTRMKGSLKTTPVLWPRSRSRLRLICQLKIVPKQLKDCYGKPLVPDLPEEKEIYLHQDYYTLEPFVLLKLITLGPEAMSVHDCVEGIGRVAMSSTSNMKSADDDWHERIARLLLLVFEQPHLKTKIPYLRSLPLIPLGDQRWVSIADKAVYFPDTDDMPIPWDLGLRLIEPKAIRHAARKTLFTKLGVVDADKDIVRELILKKHRRG